MSSRGSGDEDNSGGGDGLPSEWGDSSGSEPENFLLANKKESSQLKAIDFGLSVFFKPGLFKNLGEI